jgi:hypothetical protein
MPFRCKCGRTFEKTESFSSHTSSCAPFHERRLSDASQYKRRPSCTDNIPSMMSTSVPETTFFMPTALSIQNTFEGAGRKRSPSLQESELKQ